MMVSKSKYEEKVPSPMNVLDSRKVSVNYQHSVWLSLGESRFGLMRRFGGLKSMGPIRRQWHRPVAEVFIRLSNPVISIN